MNRKRLLNARDEFRSLLAKKGTRESEFQRLFSDHPFLLSNSLPLKLHPANIIPLGRPGKAEADFLIYPNDPWTSCIYGAIEIKRPDTRILNKPRKDIIVLSSDANTALAQGQKYTKELGTELKAINHPVVAMGNSEYVFLILGMQAELQEKVSSKELREQFDSILPHGCTLLPYDSVLAAFEKTIPPSTHILVPRTSVAPATEPRIPPIKNQVFWQLCALDCARHAHDENFSSRLGTYSFVPSSNEDGESVLCIYNNNPYANDPTLRDDETNRFRQRLRTEGIAEIAYATYPEHGEESGYSYAMFVDVPGDDYDAIENVRYHLQQVIDESYAKL